MLLWCLFSWQTPFPLKSGEEAVTAAAGKHGARPPLKELEQWPKRALQLMQRMWVADPEQRGDMSTACQTLTLCLTREKQGKGLARLSSAKRIRRDAQIMYGLDISTFAQVLPIAERTFASSNYKLLYTAARSANVPSRASQLLFACEMLVKLHAEKHPLPSGLIMDTTRFLKKMNTQAFTDVEALKSEVAKTAEYLWTSTNKLPDETEFFLELGVLPGRKPERSGDALPKINDPVKAREACLPLTVSLRAPVNFTLDSSIVCNMGFSLDATSYDTATVQGCGRFEIAPEPPQRNLSQTKR